MGRRGNVIVTTTDDAIRLVSAVIRRISTACGIDSETEGINPKVDPAAGPKGRIVCWTLSWVEAAPYGQSGVPDTVIKDAFIWANADTWQVLAPLLNELPVVGHNIWGFDAHMFRKAGAPLGNVVADTMRMHKLINTAEDAHHGLKSLMKWWLNIEPVGEFTDLFQRLKKLEDDPGGPLKETKRKVGDTPRVPSLVGGPSSRVGTITEFIPLSTIPTDYPHLLPTLIKYAKLDSRATLELYLLFLKKMKETPWEVPLTQHASILDSGMRHAG